MLNQLTSEQFDELPKERRRVILAQDVIHQLDVNKFIQENRIYIHFYNQSGLVPYTLIKDTNAKEVINANTCHVCAKGALICSYVGKFNNANVGHLHSDYVQVVDIFGHSLWSWIEDAFEGWGPFNFSTPIRDLMQSLIDNEGKFITVDGKNYD